MKILRYLVMVLLLVGILPIFLAESYAESANLTATISVVVLGAAKGQLDQPLSVTECLESQLQKNPLSLPEIKVEKIIQPHQLSAAEIIRYTICERP